MKSTTHVTCAKPDRQRGVATLLVSLVILISMTVLTFAVARTGLMEQKISANEARAKETLEAAEAALEYGVAWLAENNVTNWTPAAGNKETASPTAAPPEINVGNFSYNISVSYERDATTDDLKKYTLITASATEANDSSITMTLSQYAYQVNVLNEGGGANPAPLVMDGCLSNVGGTPDIWPEGSDPGAATDGTGISVATSQNKLTGSGDPCIDNGANLDLHSTGGADLDGKQHNVNLDPDGDGTGSVWEYVFDIDKQTFIGHADTSLTDAGPLYYITSSNNWGTGNATYGSSTAPVVIFFSAAADCPMPNGGITVYGILYIEGDCSDANGWGGVTVYGAVLVDGDMAKLNANTDLRHFSLAGAGSKLTLAPLAAPKIIGTWHDF